MEALALKNEQLQVQKSNVEIFVDMPIHMSSLSCSLVFILRKRFPPRKVGSHYFEKLCMSDKWYRDSEQILCPCKFDLVTHFSSHTVVDAHAKRVKFLGSW